MHVVGSFARAGASARDERSADHHRPFVDEVEIPCSPSARGCGAADARVHEVIDVWFDSGAMPFAQHHFPFEHEDRFAERFPADFICEAQDQTRGWFYSLLAVATLLGQEAPFDRAPYRNVVCLGLILDEDGQKMSKSKGNTVEPWQVLDKYGADAFRWYFFTSKQPWDGYRFSEEAIGEGVRLFLKQLWSTYFFYVLYAEANSAALGAAAEPEQAPGTDQPNATSEAAPPEPTDDLDRWALSRTAGTAELVAERLDAYDATSAGRAIAGLVDELSNWYVRRSRRRFWDGDPAAFETLRHCLLTVAKLLAPLCPFIADEIYDNLDGDARERAPVRLPRGRRAAAARRGAGEAMALARETVRLGLGARGKAKIKVRQPLGEAVVVADGRERAAIERLADVVREELNVRRDALRRRRRGAGQLRGEGQLPHARPAVRQGHAARGRGDRGARPRARGGGACATGGDPIGISVGGTRAHALRRGRDPHDEAPEGYSVEREGAHAVALDLAIDDDLREEGRAREIVHAVQNARKSAGLEVEDRIELALGGDPALIAAAEAHRDYLAGETLAVELVLRRRDSRAEAMATQSRPRSTACALSDRPTPSASAGSSSRLELLLRVGADDGLDRLAALEEDHRRDREHLEVRRRLLVLVDVQLHDAQIGALGGDLLEHRRDHAAGAAPGRPEVDEHGGLGLDHLGLEVGVCDFVQRACHRGLLDCVRSSVSPITIQSEVTRRV